MLKVLWCVWAREVLRNPLKAPDEPKDLSHLSTHLQDPKHLQDHQDRHVFDQYFRFNCRIRSNFAVSATAITAITPACTGSVTTRSAASGTLPGMLSEMT